MTELTRPSVSRRARWIYRGLIRAAKLIKGPYRRVTFTFVRRSGLRVKEGPFAGMRYPRGSPLWLRGLVPRLTGSYERELHPAIEKLTRAAPTDIIEIGAADGYYLVGFATRCPAARLIGYEQRPYMREVSRRVAAANGVEDRLDIRGTCRVEDLSGVEPGSAPAVFSDCEGAEVDLLDPSAVPWLRRATLIVEIHDQFVLNAGALLSDRFSPTHVVEMIDAEERYLGDAPAVLHGLPAEDRLLAIHELRHSPMSWMYAYPRSGKVRRAAL